MMPDTDRVELPSPRHQPKAGVGATKRDRVTCPNHNAATARHYTEKTAHMTSIDPAHHRPGHETTAGASTLNSTTHSGAP